MLALGRKLVEELQPEPFVDTLARWMAHDLAGLLDAVEKASPAEKPALQQACRDTVLKLWSYRAELPDGRRPFEDIEPILRALESLDPTDSTPRYFRGARGPAAEGETPETRQWLEKADQLDAAAKLLIGACLHRAAETALDKSKDWVAAAEAAGVDEGVERRVIGFLSNLTPGADSNRTDKLRKNFERRIVQIRLFAALAEEQARQWEAQLETLSSPPPE